MIAPPHITEVDDGWGGGGAKSLIPLYTLLFRWWPGGGEVIQLSNMGRGNHFQVILILFQVNMLGGALFLAEGFLHVILLLFLCFLQKKIGREGGVGSKICKTS